MPQSNGHKKKPKRRRSRKKQTKSDLIELLRRGTQALQQGRAKQATLLLEQAYALDDTHPDVALNLAGAYILTKKFSQAIALLEPLSDREPNNPMIWTNLGAAYLGNPVLATDEKQYRAIGAFKLALALDPNTPNVAYNLGLIYRDRREYDEAIHWFERALETNPQDKDARNYIKRLQAIKDQDQDQTRPAFNSDR